MRHRSQSTPRRSPAERRRIERSLDIGTSMIPRTPAHADAADKDRRRGLGTHHRQHLPPPHRDRIAHASRRPPASAAGTGLSATSRRITAHRSQHPAVSGVSRHASARELDARPGLDQIGTLRWNSIGHPSTPRPPDPHPRPAYPPHDRCAGQTRRTLGGTNVCDSAWRNVTAVSRNPPCVDDRCISSRRSGRGLPPRLRTAWPSEAASAPVFRGPAAPARSRFLDDDELVACTDPHNPDSDGDGVLDSDELLSDSNPLMAN
jgi:hypothetical protein